MGSRGGAGGGACLAMRPIPAVILLLGLTAILCVAAVEDEGSVQELAGEQAGGVVLLEEAAQTDVRPFTKAQLDAAPMPKSKPAKKAKKAKGGKKAAAAKKTAKKAAKKAKHMAAKTAVQKAKWKLAKAQNYLRVLHPKKGKKKHFFNGPIRHDPPLPKRVESRIKGSWDGTVNMKVLNEVSSAAKQMAKIPRQRRALRNSTSDAKERVASAGRAVSKLQGAMDKAYATVAGVATPFHTKPIKPYKSKLKQLMAKKKLTATVKKKLTKKRKFPRRWSAPKPLAKKLKKLSAKGKKLVAKGKKKLKKMAAQAASKLSVKGKLKRVKGKLKLMKNKASMAAVDKFFKGVVKPGVDANRVKGAIKKAKGSKKRLQPWFDLENDHTKKAADNAETIMKKHSSLEAAIDAPWPTFDTTDLIMAAFASMAD